MRLIRALVPLVAAAVPLGAQPAAPAALVWERVTADAGFPPSYNFPVVVTGDGRFVALHPQGTWVSTDGTTWRRGPLPWSGTNAAYLPYIRHDGAVWALGTLDGNYEGFTIDPLVRRTMRYESWDVVGRAASQPRLVFYAGVSYRGAIWLLGGWNGERETSEVWRSTDGLDWQLVTRQAPWSPRSGAGAIVFRDRLFLIGGGQINGTNSNDVWSTTNGTDWVRETAQIAAEEAGGTPVVYRDQLWLIGANRSGRFSSAVLVTNDGRTWRAMSAPWPARGGVAAWVHGDALYMTGGKYSTVERGETVFTYYSDVWRMRPRTGSSR